MNDASKRSSARLSRWQDRSRREGCRKQPGYRTDRDGRFEVPLEYLTANDLIRFLMERKQIEKPISVVKEFAFPPQVGVSDFNVWDEVEPPGGTFLITRYDRSTIPSPVRPAGYAAAPAIAVQGVQSCHESNHAGKAT